MTIVESVGWVLVHFIWQGVAIALALAAVLSLTSAAQATLRYALSCAALLVMLATAVATTASVMTRDPGSERAPHAAAIRETPVSEKASAEYEPASRAGSTTVDGGADSRITDVSATALPSIRPLVVAVMPWLVTAWAVGVLALTIRLVGGWWRTRRLRVDGIGPVPDWCHARLAALADRMRITRPVALLSSIRVRVPIVLGHVKPVIVVPASVLAGLSAAQLEAIIAHELAHVRRHDYLVNLAQTVIETLLFYHPAVWWVSRQIRDAREHCCDDLAVSACGSRQTYVHALLGLEELKKEELQKPGDLLALGVTDGPLLARARRLLVPSDRGATPPRLAASAIALTVVATAMVGAAFNADEAATPTFEAAEPSAPSAPAEKMHRQTPAPAGQVQEVPASSIRTAPDTSGPLAARWSWAERSARDARTARYWIGYTISPVRTLQPFVYMDRSARVLGDNVSLSGTFFTSNPGSLRFPGRRLVVLGSDRSVKVMFAFDASRGAPVLTGVHVSSLALPVETRDLPVYWLGHADAAGSQPQIERLYQGAGMIPLQNDLIAAIGVHDASPAVVAWLEGRVASGDPDDLRAEAAEWIGHHPIPRSITALDRIARRDRVSRVRQEAAEALGDLELPEAAPALIALARELEDRDARREAVEALGARPEPAAVQALESIARQDPSLDMQREAVESLGDLSGNRGLPIVIELARTHPDVNVRREAIETIGDAEPTDEIVRLLKEFALTDSDPGVQEEAVETLADLDRPDTLATLIELAKTHPRRDTRRAAVEALANRGADREDGRGAAERATVLDLLTTMAKSDADVDIQIEAVESLGGIPGAEAIARLQDVIRTHADERVRAEAVESLGDHGSPAEVAPILKSIAVGDSSTRVSDEAIEALADLPDGGGIPALVEIVREQPEGKVWRRAIEALIDSDDPRARDVFKQLKGTGVRR
jgi:beta-lactamase regulating signal transducer with metallopeptidase domain/HEAT repeat protein